MTGGDDLVLVLAFVLMIVGVLVLERVGPWITLAGCAIGVLWLISTTG